jgi:SWI/SNF-related matrix-associated actin-dependent regulator of chromatin subfamily A member 5
LENLEDHDQKQKILDAMPLTPMEESEMERLESLAFESWTRKEFASFLRGCEKYGRKNYSGITKEVETKSKEEVEAYANVFWERYRELPDWEKKITDIERGELKFQKQIEVHKILNEKILECGDPLLNIKVPSIHKIRSKLFSEMEDRFILRSVGKHGVVNESLNELVQLDIRQSPLFRFNWYMRSRNPAEIGRRINTLLMLIHKEAEPNEPVAWGPGARKRKVADPLLESDEKRAKSPSSNSPSSSPQKQE